jgi:alpha-ketoglutarate-dependent taurine dioxygenase
MPHAIGRPPVIASLAHPFNLNATDAYARWREGKLAQYPTRAGDLIVEVRDPRHLTTGEHEAILQRCRRANFALYASPLRDADKDIPRLLGEQFGLRHPDSNWLADEDGISSLTVSEGPTRHDYIPYTDRAISWHTDGYYNTPERRIWSMVLHCVSDARTGGDSAIMDHEIAYLLLRDENPEFVRALMAPDALTIPARMDEEGEARAAQTGPVFCLHGRTGDLHMRYTARTRSIEWKQDSATLAAVARLTEVLAGASPYVHRLHLAPGMGIIANNVLHQRTAFSDRAEHRRLLYRARYCDRIAGTVSHFAQAGVPSP